MKEQEWSRSDFIFNKQLGIGQFGIVYEALERHSDRVVAIKIIPKNKITSETLYRRLQREVEIHSRLKHEAICKMYGYFTDSKHVYLVLEHCPNGNLYIPSTFSLMKLRSLNKDWAIRRLPPSWSSCLRLSATSAFAASCIGISNWRTFCSTITTMWRSPISGVVFMPSPTGGLYVELSNTSALKWLTSKSMITGSIFTA